MYEKKPLYRRVNTTARGVFPGGGDYAWRRHSKAETGSEARTGSMRTRSGMRHGLDYTPLYRFLLSKIGSRWDEVLREAQARLDRPDPIFRMVAVGEAKRRSRIRLDENSYWSGLYVDGDERLAIVDPSLRVEDMTPDCPCCTHTFNGEVFSQKFRATSKKNESLVAVEASVPSVEITSSTVTPTKTPPE